MPLLEHENNRNNNRGEITHGQPIGKQISYRPYKRIASFNGYFYKEHFFDWLLDLEDLFDYENICDERKVELALYKLREYTFFFASITVLIFSSRVVASLKKMFVWAPVMWLLVSPVSLLEIPVMASLQQEGN